MTALWVDDPIGTLFDGQSASCFFPAPGDGPIERSNALARFVVYGTLLVAAMRGGDRRAVPALAMGAIALLVLAATAKRVHANGQPSRNGPGDRHASAGGPDRDAALACTPPSLNNPFANVLLGEFQTAPDRLAACDLDDPAVARSAEAYYRRGMYQATTDVYNRQASSRQFYTNPATTIPNDQRSFAQALYGTPATLKERDL